MALVFYLFIYFKEFFLNMTSRKCENLKLIVIMVYTSILEYITAKAFRSAFSLLCYIYGRYVYVGLSRIQFSTILAVQ